jgi:hypothetical protein
MNIRYITVLFGHCATLQLVSVAIERTFTQKAAHAPRFRQDILDGLIH